MRKSAVSRYLRIPRSRTGLTNVITSHEENALASALIRMKDYRHHGPAGRHHPAEPRRAAGLLHDREDL